ncbi:MAG: hypothetical protein ABI675_29655 [Chitinophagaceae bacterium]
MKIRNTMELSMIAACLSDNYMLELYEFLRPLGKGYADALGQIAIWSHDFYNAYYEKMKRWEDFEDSEDNIYKAIDWDSFLIEWGNDKLLEFKAQHS